MSRKEIIETIYKLDTFFPLLRLLNFCGMLPPLSIYSVPWKNFIYNIFSFLTFLSFMPLILMQIVGFYIHGDNLTMITVIIFQLAAYFDGMVGMYYFIRHRKRLITTFYLLENKFIPFYSRIGSKRKQREILEGNKKFTKFITTVALGAWFADMFTWCVFPSVVRYADYFTGDAEGEFRQEYFVLVMWLPQNATSFPMYEMLHVFQFFSVWGVVGNYAAGKLITVTLFFHLRGQYQVLSSAIEDVDVICTEELPDVVDEENKQKSLLESEGYGGMKDVAYVTECIRYHQELLSFTKEVNDFLTNIVLFDIIIFQILMCLPPLQLILGQNSSTVRFVSSIIDTGIWPLLICYWGEAVSQASLGVQKAVYNCRWYDRSQRVKKLLHMVLMRTREPVRMTAGQFYKLSLETFADIENKVYAYFTLLKNMNG